VIQNHNETLVECIPWETMVSSVQYHLDLNQVEWSRVRKRHVEVEAMVAMLLRAHVYQHLVTSTGSKLIRSVLYGLPREGPASRCVGHPVALRKRKERPAGRNCIDCSEVLLRQASTAGYL
jgi:hypothetical protein